MTFKLIVLYNNIYRKKTLKKKIRKHMTSVSNNVYIDKLDDIVDKYNNKYHSIIKMKSVDVKSNIYRL